MRMLWVALLAVVAVVAGRADSSCPYECGLNGDCLVRSRDHVQAKGYSSLFFFFFSPLFSLLSSFILSATLRGQRSVPPCAHRDHKD